MSYTEAATPQNKYSNELLENFTSNNKTLSMAVDRLRSANMRLNGSNPSKAGMDRVDSPPTPINPTFSTRFNNNLQEYNRNLNELQDILSQIENFI